MTDLLNGRGRQRMSPPIGLASAALALMLGAVVACTPDEPTGDESDGPSAQFADGICEQLDLAELDRLTGERDPGSDYFADDAPDTGEFDCDFWYASTETSGAWLKVSGDLRPEGWKAGIDEWVEATASAGGEANPDVYAIGGTDGEPVQPLDVADDWDAAGLVVIEGVSALQGPSGDRAGTTFELRLADGDLMVQMLFERLDSEGAPTASVEDHLAVLIGLAEQVRESVTVGGA